LNKPAIIQAGGLEALARHLRSEQSKITYHCSWTMRNLSDMAANIENPGEKSEISKNIFSITNYQTSKIKTYFLSTRNGKVSNFHVKVFKNTKFK